jgi:wyosine [tRNA(Phe)-imidazoG37] synthetase (radical SAM superfamily)
MPTQEERLETVEYGLKQFKTEPIKAYGETAMELTMVKGLTEDAVKRLASLKTQIDYRFERVDTHLDTIDTRLDRLENMLSQILARLPEKP